MAIFLSASSNLFIAFLFLLCVVGFQLLNIEEVNTLIDADPDESNIDPEVVFKLYTTNAAGRVSLPWIILPSMTRPVPICYDLSPDKYENTMRLAHLLCRHTEAMVATRWLSVSKASLRLNTSGLVTSVHCRGDEQLLSGCKWSKPFLSLCSDFLSVECGECTTSVALKDGDNFSIESPGFPFYIPLIICEWNITLESGNNLLLRFREFDLPNPAYSEDSDSLACQLGSLDLLLFHEDLGKFIVEGRFCGRHSPGKITILSSQILLRYVAGAYSSEVMVKRGFMVECSSLTTVSTQGTLSSYEDRVIRWVLIVILAFLLLSFLILAWSCKHRIADALSRRYQSWRSRNIRRIPGIDVEDDVFTPAASNIELLETSTRVRTSSPPSRRQSVRSGRKKNWSSTLIRSEMVHLRKMEQLQQQQNNARRASSCQPLPSTSRQASHDDAHVYEEVGHFLQTRSGSLPTRSNNGLSHSGPSRQRFFKNTNFLVTPAHTRRLSSYGHSSDLHSHAEEERPNSLTVSIEPNQMPGSSVVRTTHAVHVTEIQGRNPLSYNQAVSQSSSESSANDTYIDPNYGTSPSPDSKS